MLPRATPAAAAAASSPRPTAAAASASGQKRPLDGGEEKSEAAHAAAAVAASATATSHPLQSLQPPAKKQKMLEAEADSAEEMDREAESSAPSPSSLACLPRAFFQPLLRMLLQDPLQAAAPGGIPFMPTPLCDLIADYSVEPVEQATNVTVAFIQNAFSHDDLDGTQTCKLVRGEANVRDALLKHMRCTEGEQYYSRDPRTRGTEGLASLYASLDSAESQLSQQDSRPDSIPGDADLKLEQNRIGGAARMASLLLHNPHMDLPAPGDRFRSDYLQAAAELHMARHGPISIALAQCVERNQDSSSQPREEWCGLSYHDRRTWSTAAVLVEVDPATGAVRTEIFSRPQNHTRWGCELRDTMPPWNSWERQDMDDAEEQRWEDFEARGKQWMRENPPEKI